MPIANNLRRVCEVLVPARQAAAGSNDAPSINVFHFRRTTVSGVYSNLAIGTAFVASIGAAVLAASNARYTPQLVNVRNVDDATDPYQPTVFAGVGAIATDALPSDDAIVHILQSSVRGKNYQGRKHYGTGNESDTTGDVLVGAGLARWVAVKTAHLAGFTDANGNVWVGCVLSRVLSQLRRNPTTVISSDITAIKVVLNIGTMRRRRTRTVYA